MLLLFTAGRLVGETFGAGAIVGIETLGVDWFGGRVGAGGRRLPDDGRVNGGTVGRNPMGGEVGLFTGVVVVNDIVGANVIGNGVNVGTAVGPSTGVDVSLTEGASVGPSTDGEEVGPVVGSFTGVGVSLADGASVGPSTDGEEVGPVVGSFTGVGVSLADGASVGPSTDGEEVGPVVGSTTGTGVCRVEGASVGLSNGGCVCRKVGDAVLTGREGGFVDGPGAVGLPV
jgi:hypothetical protein